MNGVLGWDTWVLRTIGQTIDLGGYVMAGTASVGLLGTRKR